MPVRTGLSHALLSVVLLVLWVFFNRTLDLVVRERHLLGAVDFLAGVVTTTLGIPVSYGRLTALVTVALVTTLAFSWGYLFHRLRFGG